MANFNMLDQFESPGQLSLTQPGPEGQVCRVENCFVFTTYEILKQFGYIRPVTEVIKEWI